MNNNNNNKNPRILEPLQIAKKVDFGLIKKDRQQFDMRTNILANFTRPFIKNLKLKDSYHLFVNTYFFDYDILDIDPESLIERASKILGYQTYFLIIVYPSYEEIKTEVIKSDFYPHCEINVIHTSFDDLFSSGLMNKIYLENDNSTLAFRTIMNFRGWPYGALQSAFRMKNVILSGGIAPKRHILNPFTHRFSQFISAFESYNLNGVINSFNNLKPIEIKTSEVLKATLGPKIIKDKNSMGDISTKAFDKRYRAVFKRFFNQDLPIRESKNSVSAKKIDANVSTNTQNNKSLNDNSQVSQITVNLNQTKEEEDWNLKQDGFDFATDPWIDNKMFKHLYNNDPIYRKKMDKELEVQREITNKKLAAQLKELNDKSKVLELQRKQLDAQKIQDNLISQQKLIEKQKLEEIELNKQRAEKEKQIKLDKYFNSIVEYLINSRRKVNKIKKGQTLSKAELEPTINRILRAKSSDKYTSLNQAFPSIFKSYLNKSFGPYKRITKFNILNFKRLLLKKHPILVQKAKEDLNIIKQNKQNILLQKANEEKEEAKRINEFKIAYPDLTEIPAKPATVRLDYLELGLKRIAQENEAKEAERIRLASILTPEEIQEKRIKEIQEILNNSSIYLNDLDRIKLDRELKRLLRRNNTSGDSNYNSDNSGTSSSEPSNNNSSNNKRNYSTLAQKRSYHTTSKNYENNLNSLKNNNKILNLITNEDNKLNSSEEENEKQIKLFSFLDYVRDVLDDQTLNTFEKQTKIETEWMENIKIKLLDPEFSKTRLSIYITRAFNILQIQLGGKKNLKTITVLSDDFKTFLIKIESLILAFGYIITYCSRMNYTYIASLIGNAIFWEYFRYYNKNIVMGKAELKINPKTKNINNYDLFYSENNLNEEQAVCLGDLLIECFIRIEIIDRRFDIEDKGKAYIEIRQDCINEIVENTFIVPTSLPMCHKPNEWSDDKRGGFLSNMVGRGKDLIQGSALKEKHLIEDKKELFDSINYLDSIKFKINNDFLDYILNDGYYLLSLEDEKNWTQNLISIKIAQTFINTPFYINTFADWRGRIYTNSFFISYQGSKLAKNLVYFNEGEILNEKGFDYLYIYGANAYNENGIAKKSINERINWVQINYQKILKMEKEFLINAKEKFTFAAFCLVIRKLHQNHKALIHLPIFLDATCSGIQHLAALMKDFDSASRVNLIEQNNDDPVADIYYDVVGPVNEALNKFGLKNKMFYFNSTGFIPVMIRLYYIFFKVI
jgi:hypothetical protein